MKFQAFAEQLTKETSELKVKIEGHKRENRRLSGLIDTQKDDITRLTLRLSGTEKQRDDALEALVLQQEIAEELERERKRNQKELASLEHRSSNLARQRDEAQRIVVHLRSLIDGQTHHMEHIIRNLANSTDLGEYIDQALEASSQEATSPVRSTIDSPKSVKRLSRPGSRVRLSSAFNSRSGSASDNVASDVEPHMTGADKSQRRLSQISMPDVADRYLKDKTDAIAAIIRNISEQCAAAVEGLHLAQDAENEEGAAAKVDTRTEVSTRDDASEAGESESGFLNTDSRISSIPPTPDLVHNRSSTSMSMVSNSTIAERSSQQYNPGEIPTKIVEDEDEHLHETGSFVDPNETTTVSKKPSHSTINVATSRMIS